MAEAGLMPQRPWHSRQSDGEVMDGADDCDEQKGFFPEWTVFGNDRNETDLRPRPCVSGRARHVP